MIRFAVAFAVFAAAAIAEPALTALPAPLTTRNGPVAWTATGADSLTITAEPKTNWFVPPWNPSKATDNAPTLLLQPTGNFTLSAKVHLDPKLRWDSGALAVFVDRDNWAKLCLEDAHDDRKLSVVMVVNKTVSDDSYTDLVAADNTLWLRVSRKGLALYFYASRDGQTWTMLRTFALNGDLTVLKAGLLAQSPVGDGIAVTFSDVRYEPGR